jgi:hypothetical protein
MSLSVSFRRSARTEFIEAAAWYESERQNLGVEFIAEIGRCGTAAAERPMTYSAVYKDVRMGDECEVKGVAEVTKSTRAGGNGPGTLELKLIKISLGEEEPMKAYAKRRNAELIER